MEWVKGLQKAIDYIEDHITENIDYVEIAKQEGFEVIAKRARYGGGQEISQKNIHAIWAACGADGTIDTLCKYINPENIFGGAIIGICFDNPIEGEWLTLPAEKDELRYETLLKLFFGNEQDTEQALSHIKTFEKQKNFDGEWRIDK